MGAAVRLWLLLGSLGEMEADEAVVGLMARHVLAGEWPVFYWGQPYLGSLEAYSVAAAFALAGPSPLVLKLVPALYSLLFIGLVYRATHLALGPGPALLSALYLALPPAFFGIWSTKARGGYVEMLVLGHLVFLLVLLVEQRRQRWNFLWAGALGMVSGLSLWTHPLSVVYLVPAIGLLLVRRRAQLMGPATAGLIAGALVGAWPLVSFNLANDLATWRALFSGSFEPLSALRNLKGQVRYSWPILVGLAQASTSSELFRADFAGRPGSWPPVSLALAGVGLLVLLVFRRSLPAAMRPGGGSADLLAAQMVLMVAASLAATSLTRFGELATEPRYLLPLYSGVPLLAALVWHLRHRSKVAAAIVVVGVLAVNVYSIVTTDPRLNLPSNVGASSPVTRAELSRFLEARALDRIYTDYWIAYPLSLETGERIVASVVSGGFDRYMPYAHLVSIAPDPAFVFVSGRPEEEAFRQKLAALGASAVREEASIYVVYYNIQPRGAIPALR